MPVLRASDVGKVLLKGGRARVDEPVAPRFKPGDAVRARNIHPLGHTRLPRYARGRQGVIDRDHGVFVFPDTHAMGLGPKPQHCYAVRFAARELWGPEASPRDWIYIDLWDDHLDALQNGGPDMAPMPPTLGSAPAPPGRSSGRLQ